MSSREIGLWELVSEFLSNAEDSSNAIESLGSSYARWRERNWTLDPFYFSDGIAETSDMLAMLVAGVAAVLYGLFHGLGWDFQFGTVAERVLWRISAIYTGACGVILPIKIYTHSWWGGDDVWSPTEQKVEYVRNAIVLLACVARTYLVVESFIALPWSSTAVYALPNWAAYFPHIG
jgi:succinate dehydrogenase hydrophobic anchor subunit